MSRALNPKQHADVSLFSLVAGIIYTNGAGASTESVADMALYHIISVFRHTTLSFLSARSASPSQWQSAHQNVPAMSHNPRGHTLGIIGLGNIGFAIALKVKAALGMRMLYTDLYRKNQAQEEEIGAKYFDRLEDMLPLCDCVLIATPAGDPLLTAETIHLLPRGARVVNIARGSLIDEAALADALDSGHIDAAGLDVHADEPRVNERLARMENVTLTSHTGGGSIETNIGFERLAMENVEAVLTGRDPLTAVNMKALRERRVPNGGGADDVAGGDATSDSYGVNTDGKAPRLGLSPALLRKVNGEMDAAEPLVKAGAGAQSKEDAMNETGVRLAAKDEEEHNVGHTNGVT